MIACRPSALTNDNSFSLWRQRIRRWKTLKKLCSPISFLNFFLYIFFSYIIRNILSVRSWMRNPFRFIFGFNKILFKRWCASTCYFNMNFQDSTKIPNGEEKEEKDNHNLTTDVYEMKWIEMKWVFLPFSFSFLLLFSFIMIIYFLLLLSSSSCFRFKHKGLKERMTMFQWWTIEYTQ